MFLLLSYFEVLVSKETYGEARSTTDRSPISGQRCRIARANSRGTAASGLFPHPPRDLPAAFHLHPHVRADGVLILGSNTLIGRNFQPAAHRVAQFGVCGVLRTDSAPEATCNKCPGR